MSENVKPETICSYPRPFPLCFPPWLEVLKVGLLRMLPIESFLYHVAPNIYISLNKHLLEALPFLTRLPARLLLTFLFQGLLTHSTILRIVVLKWVYIICSTKCFFYKIAKQTGKEYFCHWLVYFAMFLLKSRKKHLRGEKSKNLSELNLRLD